MKDPKIFGLRLPPDVRKWIEQQAGLRRMTMTDFALQLLIKGVQAETVDETVSRIRDASQAGPAREVLRQTLAVRYMLETQAKDSGAVRLAEKFGSDALVWADKEMSRLFPDRSES